MRLIRFIKVKSADQVAGEVAKRISSGLNNGQVAWLVPGGSGMDIAVTAAKELEGESKLSNLSVSLTDERYGPVGHADSNMKQLDDKGFPIKGASFIPVLSGEPLEATAKHFGDRLRIILSESKYSLVLAGLGPDGHILGIKPGSPAIDSSELVIGYPWDDYVRITATIELLKKCDELIIYAVGEEKHRQLDDLDKDIDADIQPAQLLKQLKNVTIYNDYKGEQL
jgi:6-phosphogluconolactonase/glucosamine-6-phosphate isomerase/deaminase